MAARHREVVAAERLRQLIDVEAVSFGFLAVELDDDLFFFQPIGSDIGDAINPFQPLEHLPLHEVVSVGNDGINREADNAHGNARGVVLADEHAVHVIRKLEPGALGPIAHFAVGHVHVRALLELQKDPAEAERREGVDPIETVDGAQFLLEGQRDLVEHLLRRRILPRHSDEQALSSKPAREQFHRNSHRRDESNHHDAHQHHEHRNASFERKLRQPAGHVAGLIFREALFG